MRQVPLERDINIAINDPFWVEVANQEHPFTAMLISRSRGTCLIDGNLGPPISSSAIIKSFERVGAGWEKQQDTQVEMRHEVGCMFL